MNDVKLLTPGPTYIPKSVFEAMAVSDMHHRSQEFQKIFQGAAESLEEIFNLPAGVLFLACTGTGAMEAAVANLCGPQSSLLYVSAGKFGERWGAIAEAYRIPSHAIEVPWGEAVDPSQIVQALKIAPEVDVLCLQYCETSTGALHPVPQIIAEVRKHNPDVLIIVDAISAALTMPISMKELGMDALLLASQKAFMLPPGLSMLAFSERAWKRCEEIPPRSLYFDFRRERIAQEVGSSAWTPALHLILGLREVLRIFEEHGIEEIYARHARVAQKVRKGLLALGCDLIASVSPALSLTAAAPPSGVDANQLRQQLLTDYGFRVAGGQGHLKGRIFRIGHMGLFPEQWIDELLQHLEFVLSQD